MISNFINYIYIILILSITILINTILGAFLATNKKEFDIKKLFKGIFKAIIIMVCLILFCVSLELLPIPLNSLGVQIPDEVPTLLQISITILTAYKKYAVDCFNKFKTIIGGE